MRRQLWQDKKPKLSKQESEPTVASAPSVSDDSEEVATSTSIPRDVTARGLHSECVVCQDAEVTNTMTSKFARPSYLFHRLLTGALVGR